MAPAAALLLTCRTMAGQLELALAPRRLRTFGVTELVRAVREALDAELDECWVVGEVSNARMAPSGHLYLTLKDERSAISLVMFRSACERLRFRVADGIKVMACGRISLYEARGALQFYAETMEPQGLGALQLAFEQLKRKLFAQGLFDEGRKRALPFLPRTVGLITALRGAAIRDMLSIMLARCPKLQVLIRPTRMQGNGAAADIAQALEDLNRDGRAQVIILGRGGGSLEDLWAFNEELVARAIYHSDVPVVSAVGHEIDYSIADFVADARAATPSAAAQMVVPELSELSRRLEETADTLTGAMLAQISASRRELGHQSARLRDPRLALRQIRQRLDENAAALQAVAARSATGLRRHLDHLAARVRAPWQTTRQLKLALARHTLHLARSLGASTLDLRIRTERLSSALDPGRLRERTDHRRAAFEAAAVRLSEAARRELGRRAQEAGHLAAQLDAVSPLRVLDRGYAVVLDGAGRAVLDAAGVAPGDELGIRLRRGRLTATVRAREI